MLELLLADEAETERLGQDLAAALRQGDVLALVGELGSGKSTLARAIVRALAGDAGLEVPSPTFTIVQAYGGRVPVSHFDLYRLASPSELDELGLDEAIAAGAVLIEWPLLAASRLPGSTVRVTIDIEGDGRRVRIEGSGPTFERLSRSLAIRRFLDEAGYAGALRTPFPGDASARSYETITRGDTPARVLMNAPPLVLGPPVRGGKAYAEIAHTARDVSAFVAIDRALAAAGVAVPEILAADLGNGFLLTDHLGTGPFLDHDGRPVVARYEEAARLLAMLHGRAWQPRLEAGPGVVHVVPPFDRDALLIEVDLVLDWYVPWVTGAPAAEEVRAAFTAGWNRVLDTLDPADDTLVLRDFHSPNIIWREDRQGFDRLGIVDFQDALIGPGAYDVASLAMDARVTVSPEVERATVAAYCAAREAAGRFDRTRFAAAYATMAAQRNTKILGIFVRLDRRDGKPAYLRHLPRIRDYLGRAFAHPALSPLRDLYLRCGFIDEGRS